MGGIVYIENSTIRTRSRSRSRAISLENQESINNFSDTFYVEEKFVVEYLLNLQDFHNGKEMRTKVALQEKLMLIFLVKK